jgi:signal transduction histidine kinase
VKGLLKSASAIVVESCAIALIVTAIMFLTVDNPAWADRRKLFIEILLYTSVITTLAMTILPSLWPVVSGRRRVLQWSFFIATLSLICAAGTLIGSALLLAFQLEPGAPFQIVFIVVFRRAILFALLAGVIHVAFEMLRGELRGTQLAHERALKLAAEARLAALEARIHPHFLFNTLNSISALIPSSPERAERIVERMAGVLRFTLERTDRGLVDLNEELKVVADYLEIEQVRMGSRLRYEINTSGDLSGLRVPPLSIQTLAENSIRHAVATERAGGEIRVHAARNGDGLNVEVADTGPGFSLDAIPGGHGLDNLRNRLSALFGEAAGLRVERLDGWTTVRIHLPYQI